MSSGDSLGFPLTLSPAFAEAAARRQAPEERGTGRRPRTGGFKTRPYVGDKSRNRKKTSKHNYFPRATDGLPSRVRRITSTQTEVCGTHTFVEFRIPQSV